MVRSSIGFKVRVEVGVILCLTAGPNRRALGTAQVTAPFKAPQISRGRGDKFSNSSAVLVLDEQAAGGQRGAAAAAAVWVAASYDRLR